MTSVTHPTNPFEQARARLIERLSLLVVPNRFRIFPGPSDFLEAARLIREIGELHGDFVREIGNEIENNAPYSFDARAFDGVFVDATADAAFACEAIAERLQDEREAA